MLIEALFLMAADPAAIRCGQASLSDAVADYARRTQAMDTPGIAALYGSDGQIVMGDTTLTGEAAVTAFLNQFSGYRIKTDAMTIAGVTALPGGWRSEGSFMQAGTRPNGNPYEAHGHFKMDWRCDAAQGWRVVRLESWGD